MTDLFGEAAIPGLRTAEELISTAEEADLILRIDAAGLTPFQFGQFEGKRLTRSYGSHYDFARHRLVEAEPMPDWLLSVRAKAAAFAGLAPDQLVHALLIRYDPGSGIGWHKDRPAFDRVIGISLGSDTELAFRRRREGGGFDRHRLRLPGEALTCCRAKFAGRGSMASARMRRCAIPSPSAAWRRRRRLRLARRVRLPNRP